MSHTHSDGQLILIKNFYRAFAAKDLELLKTICSHDWKDIPLAPGQQPGPEGIIPIIESLHNCLEGLTIEVKETISTFGRVAVRASILGRHIGSVFGEKISNKPVEISVHEFHYIGNGVIQKTHHMEDWLGFFHQVGSFPHF
jgi:predicted ester cyclase